MNRCESVFRESEWEGGLRCGGCSHRFTEGERFSEQLDGFLDGLPMVVIVCVPCGMGLEAQDA